MVLPLCLGWGLGSLSALKEALGNSPRHPHTCQRAASAIPSPDATHWGSPHLQPLSSWGGGVQPGEDAYPAQTRSAARLGCQERWLDHRSLCTARGGPDSATREEKRKGESVALAQPMLLAAPTPVCTSHPKARGWHSTGARQGPGTKGLKESANFPPQLISSFPPMPPQLEVGWLQRSKAGRGRQDAGRVGG